MPPQQISYNDGPKFTLEAFEGGFRWLYPDGTPTDIVAKTEEQAIRSMTMGHCRRLTEEWLKKNPGGATRA